MKHYKIGNGWNKNGRLREIGPSDFDEYYEDTQQAEAIGIKAPYKQEGSYYVFTLKRDFEAALATLERNGFVP